MRRITILFILLVSTVMFSSPSYSAASIRYLCIYPLYSSDDGTHKTKKAFKLEFIEDTISKKAVIVGNLG